MVGERPTEEPDPDAPPPLPPSARAGAALNAFIERVNPGLLADLIIHATAAQEKTNRALREKGSHYRISEMYLTASIPPQVGFYIARMGDPGEEAAALPAGETPAPVRKKAAPAQKAAKKRAPRPAGP